MGILKGKDVLKIIIDNGGNTVGLNLSNCDFFNANLFYLDLKGINFSGSNMQYVKLTNSNLNRAILKGVDLYEANLRGANLYRANLRGVDLEGANLREVDLYRANLREVDLYRADLYEADLYEANLRGVDLRRVDLRGADLRGADLEDAELSQAKLDGVIVNYDTDFWFVQCPEKGEFIGYKKAGGTLVELLITGDALRSSATTRKCRCNKAKVLDITSLDGNRHFSSIPSDYNEDFVYIVDKIIEVEDFDTDRWKECTTGIHFFVTKSEAINY